MNRLPRVKRAQILNLLVEGVSMRAASRFTGVSINTVTKLMIDAGIACAKHHDKVVTGLELDRVQCDEIWSFCYVRKRNLKKAKKPPMGAGDVWTWTAIDPDTKLVISYLVGGRDEFSARQFIEDVRDRLACKVQLTTDGLPIYMEAVDDAFGEDIDYAQLVKLYGPPAGPFNRPMCKGSYKKELIGYPDKDGVCTSHVERHNLTMRTHMKRYARLTNGHSKKIENHIHMVAVYTTFYNFIRFHQSLGMPPAMAAGLSSTILEVDFIVDLIEKEERCDT